MKVLIGIGLIAAPAYALAAEPPPPADPLTVSIYTKDADRFAALFAKTGGAPAAEQIQADYLNGASYGVEVFTPGRIKNAEHLTATIRKNPEPYRRAIETCLPAAKAAEADLRSVYLGLRGLLPDANLPQIYLVFGAHNSGGTAGPGAQVLGLETLCAVANDPASFRMHPRILRAAKCFSAGTATMAMPPKDGRTSWATGSASDLAELFRSLSRQT